MNIGGTIDPSVWLGDGQAVRVVSTGVDGNRALLEGSRLYEWFFDTASRVDIVGIACTKFVERITQGVEFAKRPGAEDRLEEWLKAESYIGRNVTTRPLQVRISIPSPDSEYIRLRESEGDTECRNKILNTIGRLRCLSGYLNGRRRINLPRESYIEVRLTTRNPCFSVFRVEGEQCGNYRGTMMGIIGQGDDAKKTFPAIWIPAHVKAVDVAEHLAMVRQQDRPLFRWNASGCEFTEWTDREDVFLSYNHAEHDVVNDLENRLNAFGVRCFLDSSELRPGDNWEKKIQAVLRQARCVLICMGSKGLGPWQQSRELIYLLAYQHGGARIIPVWLCGKDERKEMPPYLKEEFDKWHAIEFDSAAEFGNSVDALVRAVREANRPQFHNPTS